MLDRQAMGIQSPAPAAPSYRVPMGCASANWAAMGTTIHLIAPAGQIERARERTQALFAAWEAALSRFQPTSDLSRLNAAGTATPVSDLLWRVLATALEAARASQGIYDPTLGQQMLRIGYDRSFTELLAPTLPAAPHLPPTLGGGWQRIIMDAERRTVTLPAGVLLDFGGIAKGMAVDAALAELAAQGGTPALVNAGGDLAVVGTPPDGGWMVAVPALAALGQVTLRAGALATSSIGQRRWQQGATPRHHLLDSRTGIPIANGIYAVTVATQRCAQAEVAAKVALILGPQQGRAFLDRWGIAGRFVATDGRVTTTASWTTTPEEGA